MEARHALIDVSEPTHSANAFVAEVGRQAELFTLIRSPATAGFRGARGRLRRPFFPAATRRRPRVGRVSWEESRTCAQPGQNWQQSQASAR